MSRPKLLAILNILALMAVLSINTLANSLPINGYNTGQISRFYPNLFVPAGFTFSIWSVIYLLMIGFTAHSVRWLWHRAGEPTGVLMTRVSPLFILSCMLNAGWILVWHYLLPGISVGVMLLFLALLIRIYLVLQAEKKNLSGTANLFLYQFFVVYLGWISVATIANITAWLVSMSWSGFGIAAATYSTALIITATLLGIFFAIQLRDAAYALVIAWALFGINAAQAAANPMIGFTAKAGMIVLLILASFSLLRKRLFR